MSGLNSEPEFDKIVKGLNKAVGMAVEKGHRVVTQHTPLDTGRLRSTWDTTLNSPSSKVYLDPRKPRGHIKGVDLFKDDYSSSFKMASRVSKYFNILKNKDVYITNNTVYVPMIDARYSMVAKGKVAVEAELRNQLRFI